MTEPQVIADRYRIVERIGAGGMATVYKAIDDVEHRAVAIKLLSKGFDAENANARPRFVREARAASKLVQRNIVTVLDFGEHDGVPYYVMELLRGQSLAARALVKPLLTLDEKLDVVAEVCAALQFAHDHGVVHRDVKPANILRLEDGTVKLLDFGVARVPLSTLTKRGEVVGSGLYMAPEQALGKRVDGRADIFSCGVVLYELLSGRSPFQAESITATILKITAEHPVLVASVVSGIPEGLSLVLETALQKNPADRYQHAADLRADLQLIRMSLQSPGDEDAGAIAV